jgi:putative ubiquitin-RnfH superfamily antitoxin RatB of RatAB toxin-antitoxin module
VLGERAADWEHAATGINGRVCARTQITVHRDSNELYRPLKLDPRAKRRARAAQAQRAPWRGGPNRT